MKKHIETTTTRLRVLRNVYAKDLIKKDEPVLDFLNGGKMKLSRIENCDLEEEWAGLAWLRDQIINGNSQKRETASQAHTGTN